MLRAVAALMAEEERVTNAGLAVRLVKVDAAELGRASDTDEVGAKAWALGNARAAAATARTLYFIVEWLGIGGWVYEVAWMGRKKEEEPNRRKSSRANSTDAEEHGRRVRRSKSKSGFDIAS
jgi:hypothetical protein